VVGAKFGYRLYRLQLTAVSLLLWLANSSGGLADHVHLSPASVTLQAAYASDPLRASAALSNPDTYREGINTYRWIVNGAPVAQGVVPQSLLLPLDGDLHGTNGQAPSHSQGLSFVAGLFGKSLAGLPGQAIQMSRAADSRLAYPAANTVSPAEGSIEMWVKLAHDLDTRGATYDDRPRLFSYMVDSTHTLFVDVNEGRVVVTSINGGQYHSTWPTPPHWRAGEWHYVAAPRPGTWAAEPRET
jgi:hypothetical protein